MNKFSYPKLAFVIVSFVLLFNCNNTSSNSNPIEFKEIIELEYAKGIKIYRTNEGHVVTVTNPVSGEILDHFLISKKEKTNLSNIKTIKIPLENVLTYSSTYISFLDALGEISKIKGVTYSQGISNLKVKHQLSNKETIDIGNDQEPDKELIVSLKPDVALIYPSNGNHDWFSSFGIPSIINVEYLEVHPLAQVEWIKLYGILFEKEELANSIFNTIKEKYLSIKNERVVGKKPVVLCGELYDNVWTLPGGKSFINQLIEDAGAIYFLKSDSSSGSRKLDFEFILQKESSIDYWMLLSYNQKEITYSFLKENYPRYSYLSVFKPNKIAVCNSAKSTYFETSILEPHLLLNDVKTLINNSENKDSTYYFLPLKDE